jgi:hypothetical protein
MFGFSSRSRWNVSRTRASSFRPRLEALEPRYCPSTLYVMMQASPSSKQVSFTGQVTNTSSPGGLTVLLSGVVGGTTTTDSNGYFQVTLPASGQGTAYLATADGQSNIAQVAVTDPATTINEFTEVSGGISGVSTFSGSVQGGYQGEVVNFSGLKDLQGQSATCDANGNFEISVQLDGQPDDEGEAYAQATDAWGVQSNEATFYVTQSFGENSPPPPT